jgi:hypothetical protein
LAFCFLLWIWCDEQVPQMSLTQRIPELWLSPGVVEDPRRVRISRARELLQLAHLAWQFSTWSGAHEQMRQQEAHALSLVGLFHWTWQQESCLPFRTRRSQVMWRPFVGCCWAREHLLTRDRMATQNWIPRVILPGSQAYLH